MSSWHVWSEHMDEDDRGSVIATTAAGALAGALWELDRDGELFATPSNCEFEEERWSVFGPLGELFAATTIFQVGVWADGSLNLRRVTK